jgi:drug/metabolite transporter (DMT)-like permease
MQRSRPGPNPRIVVIIAVFFTSFASILVRLSSAPPLVIAAYRLAMSSALLLAPFLGGLSEKGFFERKDLLLCMTSGVFLAFHFFTWFVSLQHTTVAASTVLVNTHPVLVMLGSVALLHEHVDRRAFLFIGLALAGSVVISLGDWQGGEQRFFGDLMALLGAVSISGYLLIGRVVRRRISLPLYTFTVYASSTVVLLLLAAFTRVPLYPYAVKEFLLFAALAVVCTLGGHTLLNWALEHVEPAFVSTAILGEPVVASLAALLLFREIPPLTVVLGGAVVVAGIFFFIRVTGRQRG